MLFVMLEGGFTKLTLLVLEGSSFIDPVLPQEKTKLTLFILDSYSSSKLLFLEVQ